MTHTNNTNNTTTTATTATTVTNTTTATTTNTTTATTATTTTKTTTTYTTYTLKGKEGWKPNGDQMSASSLALQIMTYRRQYGSKGIANFAKNYLEPTLSKIVEDLKAKGYIVATQVVGKNEHGDKSYCLDVSKDGATGTTLYVAHYDTVDKDLSYSKPTQPTRYDANLKKYVATGDATPAICDELLYKHVSIKNGIAYLDKTHELNKFVGCLGADCGAGLAVMISLLAKGVIGGYCFTTGEECGGIGAEDVLTHASPFLKQYTHSVEIDRRNCEEIIMSQSVGDCASETFTRWICNKLDMGHKPSSLGSYTDVATFAQVIPENVNIASGYVSAHTADEKVDLVYLDTLAEKLHAISLTDWASAPIAREAGDFGDHFSYKKWGKGKSSYDYYGGYYDDYYGDYYSKPKSTGLKKVEGGKGKGVVGISEHVRQMLLSLFTIDPDFMNFVLQYGAENDEAVDELMLDWYGYSMDEYQDSMALFVCPQH